MTPVRPAGSVPALEEATIELSVVIPTFNRAALVVGCLEGLARQEPAGVPVEVIVVDDGSRDDTADRVRALAASFPVPLTCLRKPNGGAASARNAGVAAARGARVAFLDDDCLPPPGWLREVVAAIRRAPHAAGIGGFVEPVGTANLVSRYVHERRLLAGPAFAGGRVESLITANAVFKKVDLEQVGGFDEAFRGAGGEDVDLSQRLLLAGRALVADPRLVVSHHHRAEIRPFLKGYYGYGYGSGLIARKRGRRPGRARLLARRALALVHLAAAPLYAARHLVDRVSPRDALAFGALDALRKTAYALGKSEALGVATAAQAEAAPPSGRAPEARA